MSSSAPCSRQTASFSGVDAAAITRAPMILPSSTAARPTPPAAPRTRSVSPSRRCARSFSAWCEVPYVIRNADAVTKSISAGIAIVRLASTASSSANPPQPVEPITRSPTLRRSTPSPSAVTTPATSPPGANGSGGRNWYLFWMMRTSGKLTPHARTASTTSPCPAVGDGNSSTTSESGGPYSLQRTAFMHAHSSSVTRAAALREILLVILLGRVERRGGHDRGDDRPLEPAALLEPRFRRDGRRLLRGVVEEDRRAVLRPHVGSLAIHRRRIVLAPEDVEQLLVRHARGIVVDEHALRVAGTRGAHLLVRRILDGAAGVADGRL